MKEKCRSFFCNKNNLLIIVLLGILLLVINIPVTENEKYKQLDSIGDSITEQTEQDCGDELQIYCSYLEEKLEAAFSKLDGAGKVEVLVTMEASGEKVVEKDCTVTRSGTLEEDSQGGKREISSYDSAENTVFDDRGSSVEPYVVKVLQPRVAGIMVLAEGAGFGNVSKNISDALQALFGIEAHKIKVVKMETQ